MPETTRCAGSDVQADSPVCPGCGKEHDRYRDQIAGRIVFRFVEHSRQVAEVPDALVRAILNEQPRERAVPCFNLACRRPTFNVRFCDDCLSAEEEAYRRSEDFGDAA